MLQKQGGIINKPTRSWSEVLGDQEQKLETTHQKWYVFVRTIVFQRFEMECTKYTVQTNDHTIKSIDYLEEDTRKIARTQFLFSAYSFASS